MNGDKTAVITGATSGIGSVVAEHLVKSGYSLYVLGRSEAKLNHTIHRLSSLNPNSRVEAILCELSSFDAVRKACNELKASTASIDLLILNAGLWNFSFRETENRIEETLQVNLLSQVLILTEVMDLIPKNKGSKVIFTISGLHQGTINFKDIELRATFSGFKAYRQSKLGLILLTRWLAIQPEYSGISFYGVHPGMVNTQIGRNAGWLSRSIFRLLGKSKTKGAQTHIYLIDRETTELKSGECYADGKVLKTTAYSCKMEEAKRLWDTIHEYLKISGT